MTPLESRLDKIIEIEGRLPSSVFSILSAGTDLYVSDLFLLGAAKRTLSQSHGFRMMIEAKNFPCAAILLRTQLDTAMRIYGLRFLPDPENQLAKLMSGERKFSQLNSSEFTEKGKPKRLLDNFLRQKLGEEVSWLNSVYGKTSDYVHLSFRHAFGSTKETSEMDGEILFELSAEDLYREDSHYFEICDAFADATKLSIHLVTDCLRYSHAERKS